jgi:DHA2 family methylenomycin A resistance protein-like MFS transporter
MTTTTDTSKKALVAVCLGFALIQLDATIVNVALPTVQHDLGGSTAALQWILNGYTVALAAVLLTAGSIADRIGARRVFLTGLGIFAVGSAACAAAPDVGLLIAARVLQGMGAAALLPTSLALIVHQFPDRAARARALGVWGGIASLGLTAGPVLGGVIAQYTSWRVIFIVNVPAVLLTWWLVANSVTETPKRDRAPVDIAGLLLGVVALAGLAAGFIDISRPELLVIGIVAAIGLCAVELRSAHPMIPPTMFRLRAFSAGTGVGLIFNFCLYGTLLCLSLLLQQVRHTTVLHAGLELLPMTVVVGLGALCSGRLTARFGSRPPMIAGLSCGAFGAVVLASTGSVLVGSMLLGLCSLAMPAMTAVVVGAAPDDRAGLASGVLNASRQSGGALGVAVLGTLFHRSLGGPLLVVVFAYLAGIALTCVATQSRRS